MLLAWPAVACFELSGEAQQGALMWAKISPSYKRAYLDDEPLKISSDGIVVFGFSRDQTGTVVLGAEAFDYACETEIEIKSREYRIQHVDGVPQRTVTPDPKDMERIRRERELVRAAKANTSDRADFAAGFQWPVTGPISGVYGSQRVYNGHPGSPHWGVDVAVPEGTRITAPAPGVVTLAEPDLFYSGGTIIIDHGSEVSSSFLHLSEVTVEVGQRVEPGDVIGKVGNIFGAQGADDRVGKRVGFGAQELLCQQLACAVVIDGLARRVLIERLSGRRTEG